MSGSSRSGTPRPRGPGCSARRGTWSPTTPACCSPRPVPHCWSWSWSPRCGRPAAGCGTSRGTCRTCTRTWAPVWHCRTSCGPVPTSSATRLRPGTHVLVEGPYGTLTGGFRQARKVTMIASGVGVTPLRALLEELPYAPGHAVLVQRARTEADLLFRGELAELAKARGVRLQHLVGPRAAPGSWLPAGYGDDAAA